MNDITITDWIQAVASIMGFFAAVISLFQSRKAIKLTQKSISDANRPYAVIYLSDIQISDNINKVLVLKNFGKSGAIIKSITVDEPFDNDRWDSNPFEDFTNYFLAPGQTKTSIVYTSDEIFLQRTFTIVYTDSYNNEYCENITVDENAERKRLFSKVNISKKQTLNTTVARSIQELIRHNL